jgi:hypothetical protein
MKYPAGLALASLRDVKYLSGAYVPQLKVKRKICVSIYRIQRLGLLFDDVRCHIAL